MHSLKNSHILTTLLGTGHKVTARVGWSDLGWAMENLWAVSMGLQFFCMSTVGPPNKNPCLFQKIKILIIKVNKTIQIIKCKWCIEARTLFIQQQEVVESQQIQLTGEQLSIVIGDECVGQDWRNMDVNTVPVYIYNVHTYKFFYYKSVFSQFRLVGWVMKKNLLD